ncbi:MAG: hypothetical protein AMK75_00005, partial [Planctomycetes bacterium SM23_65]
GTGQVLQHSQAINALLAELHIPVTLSTLFDYTPFFEPLRRDFGRICPSKSFRGLVGRKRPESGPRQDTSGDIWAHTPAGRLGTPARPFLHPDFPPQGLEDLRLVVF